MNLIDEEYTLHPFYGVRRMKVMLERKGHKVSHKRIRRLSRKMGIEAIYPKPRLTKPFSEHKKYPYLLRGLKIERPDQVWCSDITYIRTKYGFVYLTAIMDWFSRYVLSFEVSTTLDKEFCIKALKNALESSKPEILNSDQGVQFTNDEFTSCLKEKDIRISMDGRGRAHDNIFIERLWRTVKYEEVYLKEYETVKEAISGLRKYFYFYNNERPHQALEYKTPCEVYQNSHYETNFINLQDGLHDKNLHLKNTSILS
jgi:putative transposase